MYPELHVPGIGVTVLWSRVLLVVAVLVQSALAYRWLRRDGIAAAAVVRALAVFWVAALAGGRTHHLLAAWNRTPEVGWQVLASPSFHTPGMLVGALVAIAVFVPRLGVPGRLFFDGVAASAGVAFAIARLGCFLNGCCYGTYCPHPWGVVFPRDSPIYLQQIEQGLLLVGAPRLAPVHPLQLYFAGAGLAIAAALYWRRARRRFAGEIGLAFLVLFASSSAHLERWRADDPSRVYVGAWPQLQAAMTVLALAAMLALVTAEWRAGRRRLPAPH